MKKLKSIVAVLLVSMLIIIPAATVSAAVIGANSTSAIENNGTYQYIVKDDGTIKISNYVGPDTTSLDIPSTMKVMVNGSMSECTVTEFGYGAFSKKSFERVSIPNTVKIIGRTAFKKCANLKSVEIPDSVTLVDAFAFTQCESLESLIIGSSVSTVGDFAFSYCPKIKSVVIPDSLTYLDLAMFSGDTSLETITIPGTLTYIDYCVFNNCTGLRTINYAGTAEKWNSIAVGGCNDILKNTTLNCNSGKYVYSSATGTFINPSSSEEPTTEPVTEPVTESVTVTPVKPAKTTITIKKSQVSIYLKDTIIINATVKNGRGNTTYVSSNKKIAKVDKTGKVTAIMKGTAKIIVANNGVKKTFTVTVKKPKLNANAKSIKKGKTFTLKITGQVGKATYKSSNTKVAKVNSNGKITAKKIGKATITVMTNGIKLTSKITVTKNKN